MGAIRSRPPAVLAALLGAVVAGGPFALPVAAAPPPATNPATAPASAPTRATGSETGALADPCAHGRLDASLRLLDADRSVEQRTAELDRLAGCADPRFVPLFETLLKVGEAPLRRGAMTALARIPDPRATAVLVRRARSRQPDASDAVAALGDQNTDEAFDGLVRMARDHRLDQARRTLARNTAAARYSARFSALPDPPRIDTDGRELLAAGSAYAGAILGASVGSLSVRDNLAGPIATGTLTLAAAGAGTAVLVGDRRPVSRVRGYRALSYSIWGSLYGTYLGAAAVNDADTDSPRRGRISLWSAASGSLFGLGAAALDAGEVAVAQQGMVDYAAFFGGLLGQGAMDLFADGDRFLPAAAVASAGSAAGLVAMRLAASHYDYQDEDLVPLLTLPVFVGGWISLVGGAINNDLRGRQLRGLIFGGLSLGAVGGLAVGHWARDHVDVVGTAEVFSIYGGLAGLGVHKFLRAGRAGDLGMTAAGGAVGATIGGLAADRLDPTPAGRILAGFGTVFGYWQGAAYADEADASDRIFAGSVLLGMVAAPSLAIAADHVVDLTLRETGAIVSDAFLGTWTGTLIAWIRDREGANLPAAIGGSAGVAGGAALLAAGAPAEALGWAGVGGLVFSGVGALGGWLLTPDAKPVEAAALAGLAVGAAGGYALGHFAIAPRNAEREPRTAGLLDFGGSGVRLVGLAPMADPEIPDLIGLDLTLSLP